MSAPEPNQQQVWQLEIGDEVVMGSDGLFEQFATRRPLTDLVNHLISGSENACGLFDLLSGVLHEALRESGQQDDITMVLLRREKAQAALPGT